MLLNAYNTTDVKTFLAPGRIWAGNGLVERLPSLLPPGPRLLVADAMFAPHPAVETWQPSHTILVSGEPSTSKIALEIANLPKAEFAAVLALGGGSVIDAAKAAHTYLSYGSLEVRDQRRPQSAPLLVAAPTTAGSGSETSRFFILNENGRKRAWRSWGFVPDLTVLDPRWLEGMSKRGVVLGAFDAFCHLWETFVCRNERSLQTDMLALTGIPKIAAAIGKINAGQPINGDDLAGLQFASALGGQAISNVRTGLIHTLAESLSPFAPLSHPETLWVFYAKARESYRDHVLDRIAQMDAALGGPGGLHRMDRAWDLAFEQTNITKDIASRLNASQIDMDALMANVMRDTVLLKENPAPIDWTTVNALVSQALGEGRLAA